MSKSIPLSSKNKSFLNKLKKPGESYDDVIEMLLEDYMIDFTGWAERAMEAWAEHRRGK